ncbi:UPAR/Ly6 domain-containing protein rtv-like [Panulirus ornatus]|uniref:UPAR/Ly6 domain-containing protein rtv-like n=1 Tax=Panulirus ornatus TaxID=150431 RepID=UPI003A89292E
MAHRTTGPCFLGVFVILMLLSQGEGQLRRCYSCRSRGQYGDCKDPVSFNASRLVPGVEAVPCASSWCSKIIEGKKDGEDHDLATERQCLQRSPPDNIQRCAEAMVGNKKVFICFCNGDLCNSASGVFPSLLLLLVMSPALLLLHWCT